LIVNGADLTIERDDTMGVFELVTHDLIYTTLFAEKPLSDETKQMIKDEQDQTRWEKGRLKSVAERKGQSFTLNHLKMSPLRKEFKATPDQTQLAELEQYFGHPLPDSLKEIFIHYNGCRPGLNYFADNEDSSLRHFYFLNDERETISNIWWAISTYSEFLAPETLPFAEDRYGGVFFLKWVDGAAQVWLFQCGDQPFEYDYDNEEENNEEMPVAYRCIANSLDELLEALYAISN
jgi:hypothetical protein